MTKPKQVALYARVSTGSQSVENQLRVLRGVADRHGWEVVATFADEGISGAKGRDQRPALDRMLKGVARREFDMVAAWSVDRLGRSLIDLVDTLEAMRAKGVGLYLDQQGLDTSTPAGKAMFQVMGVFAEFERAMISERVHAGLKRAAAKGSHGGRPKTDSATEAKIRKALAAGKGMLKVSRECGVGVSVVVRVRREMTSA